MKETPVPNVVLSAQQNDAEFVNQTLREAGHRAQCHWYKDLEKLDSEFDKCDPNLIAVFAERFDPDLQTIAALRQRHSRLVPMIVLQNSIDEDAISAALECGAQDLVSIAHRDRFRAVALRELRTFRLERALNRTLESASEYKAQLRSIMAGSADAMADVQEGIVVAANQAWADILGYECPEFTYGPVMDFVDSSSQVALKGALLACLQDRWDEPTLTIAALRHEGKTVSIEIQLKRSRFDGEAAVKMTIVKPPEESKEPVAVFENSLHTDPSTGLNNRQRFLELLGQWLESPGTSGARALALLRVDKFREIMNEVGSIASEDIITQVAESLSATLGPNDAAGRLGGTTLAVMLDRGAIRDIEAWAEHLVSRVAESTFESSGKSISATCTIGIAEVGPDTSNIEELVRIAEQAKRKGREDGGDQVVLEEAKDESTQIKRSDALWVHQIKAALVENRFRLVHLGVATLNGDSKRILDTVLRMVDQQGDEVAASKFMDPARRNGLARPIDRWVIGASIRYCAVNECDLVFLKLSADSIADEEVVEWASNQCREHGVEPSRICMQIAEEDATQLLKQSQLMGQRLKEAGFGLAIEHFGIGRDPIRLLQQLPTNYIKIDGALMESVAAETAIQDRVRAYVAAARQQNTSTIAERVDDANTMAVLFQIGVAYIQGHYVHEPEVVLSESA